MQHVTHRRLGECYRQTGKPCSAAAAPTAALLRPVSPLVSRRCLVHVSALYFMCFFTCCSFLFSFIFHVFHFSNCLIFLFIFIFVIFPFSHLLHFCHFLIFVSFHLFPLYPLPALVGFGLQTCICLHVFARSWLFNGEVLFIGFFSDSRSNNTEPPLQKRRTLFPFAAQETSAIWQVLQVLQP